MDETQKRWKAVSAEDGKVSFTGIPSGHTYTLAETKVPSGYAATGNRYTVVVAYDNTSVSVYDVSGKKAAWDGVIVNNTYYELPSTGGGGTKWFTVGGLALMTAAGFGLCRIKRKRRREDTASF